MMSKSYPSLVSVAVSPGFVETEMVKSYRGRSGVKQLGGGSENCAPLKLEYTWMSCWKLNINGLFHLLINGVFVGDITH